ncbi:hypothetical protein QQS21_003968 [Conoideocrella luteorostrata]|uniref:Glutamate-1-semialdehyde 2,1-aminomutase n=1 Tax=Conoideocrella luteorostrata TaxID=1105319 RepID=A0AAJ0CWG3_9HYPO|nr:hypothetical protein QQS21_003968 [Conoideocrella luteorostrata]
MSPHSPALDVAAALQAARRMYIQQNPKSRAIYAEALLHMPGGNTRAVLHADPFPLYMQSGRGHQVVSEDGKTYTDLTGEFSAALYGHSNPTIQSAIQGVLVGTGLNLSSCTRAEVDLAREVCQRFRIDHVRFTNSGTEANLQALAAARHFTGKRKIVVFGGAYHGGVLGFAGGKPAANNVDLGDWVVAKYNDLADAVRAIRSDGVAGVLVECMQGAGGCIVGTGEFLKGINKAARQAGVLLIIDEVMTSRMSAHGLSSIHNLTPDLKTFGKWLGGGLAFGAFGGRADVMAAYDPRKTTALPHSGTFNNNTLAMRAGYVGLTEIYTAPIAEQFTEAGTELITQLNAAAADSILCFTGYGTVMTAHFPLDGRGDIRDAGDVEECVQLKELFWLDMLQRGFWIARRGLVSLILHMPGSEMERFVDAVRGFVGRYEALLRSRTGFTDQADVVV